MVQQVALALGVAVVGGVFFGALGGATTRAAYDGALAAALTCNLGLLAATFALALGLRRGADGMAVPGHGVAARPRAKDLTPIQPKGGAL